VWLGSKQSRRYALYVSPQESDLAAAGLYGVTRLLASLSRPQVRESRSATPIGSAQVNRQTADDEGLFRSPAMLALLASAKRVAPLDVTVLLTGESGTGKEVVANIIHRVSGAPEYAFVAFNCATVPRDMVDSQLFGYRRGAFTGAVQGFKGVISAADGGTLLLDEVGELPIETQPKLLRFMDSGEVQALGEAAPRKLRVRVIAATNADLESLVQQGRFREDLYYRLNVVRFRLPPLRERREEIEPLVSMFLSKYSAEFCKHNIRLSEAAREHLLLFSWPGNVRQLSHEVRRLVALSETDSTIDVHDLDARLRGESECQPQLSVPGSRCITVRIDRPLADIVQEIEGAAIADAIEATNGRLDLASKRLGLSRKGLYLKRQRLGFL
jgi:hydrogenase-4 transcriptional activator